MRFTKMQAFGNDYVYIDAIHQELKNLPELARFVSDRHFAIGSDGMVLICPVVTELPEFVEQPVQVLDGTFHITAVSWGNPHCAMYVDSVADLDVEGYGKTIEHMTSIFPNKTNVTFVEFVRKDYIKIREWERGTGETIGCGTGCATAVVAGVLTGRTDRKVTVEQIGGPLFIEWDEKTNHLFMTGPSHTVFESEIDASHIIG